jgi:phosphohistidine swiveling domain-containing protein
MKDKWIIMNEEDKVCLWNVYSFCRVFHLDYARFTKFPAFDTIFEFDNYHFRGFFLSHQSLKIAQKVLTFVLNNRNGFIRFNKEVIKSSENFYKFGTQALEIDPKKLSNKQLVDLFEKFDEIFLRNISFGMITTLIDIPHGIFTKKVSDILTKQVSLLRLKRTAFEYLTILTKIEELSGRQQESIGLLKMYEYVLKNKIPPKYLESNKKLSKLVKQHVKKLCWVYYSYMGPAFDEKKVYHELRILMKGKTNPTRALKQIYQDLKSVKFEQKQAERELKLNPLQKTAIWGLRECLRMKVIRKDALDFASYSLEDSLREVARRAYIPFEDARFIIPGEFNKVLHGDKTIINDLPRRKEYSLVIGIGGRVNVLSGELERKFLKKINFHEESATELNEVQGQVACPGKVKGKVKIINLPSDMAKMQKGDILVSMATIPDLVPAMKKAAAIVTEQGGITSHAAIVSRELGVPCVIGTKIATKVFKDGDLVEVDANKGIVRKI